MPAPLRDAPQQAIELIKSFEGIPDGDPSTVNLDAYLDPVGIWTIGWGHAITVNGSFLRGAQNRPTARALYPGGITLAQAEALLRGELVNFTRDVLKLVRVALDEGQFGALLSFAFNCGVGNLGASTLLRKLNAGDYGGAADQFLVWNKSRKDGVLIELPGLTRRRRAERALFLGQDWRAAAATRERAMPGLRGAYPGPERPAAPAGQRAVAKKVAKPVAPKPAAPKKAVKTAAKKAVATRAAAPAKGSAAKPPARTTTAKAPKPRAPAKRPARPAKP